MSDDHSSSLRLVVAPVAEPLTLTQAKTFLRIEHTADDDAVTRAIISARLAAEQYLRLALITQTWEYSVANLSCDKLSLALGPAQSITSVSLTTETGAVSTLNASNYRLSVDGFTVLFTSNISIEKIAVRYSAGIATSAAEVPVNIIQGMLHHITVMLENRDGDMTLPMQTVAAYESFRRISL